ncbi:MAG: hypothetical protein K2J15_04355, partial [Muribaculaceae bacterium]|nr:hypothetical protein [Muribaculaceae bacterium]
RASSFKNLQHGETVEFDADGQQHTGVFHPVVDDKVDLGHHLTVSVNVANDSVTGVITVETQDGKVRYFNLQGVEIENPENGIYLKEANGKVSKVIVK